MKDCRSVAQYVVDYCTRTGNPISNLQLQKILYYIQINFYRYFGYACLEENSFQAWEYGPVVPKVYNLFKSYGATKICNVYSNIESLFNKEEAEWCKNIINVCASLDVWDLVQRSHKAGSPWEQVYNGQPVLIPEELIKKYALSM